MTFPFQVLHDISLSSLSTFGIGGLAKNYIPVDSRQNLIKTLNFLHKNNVPFKIFSGGSNIVFPDKGVKDFLIHWKKGNLSNQGKLIIADAGVLLKEVIELAINNGLSGLENLSGIPGSIGGAVVGNAGAYGNSVSEVVFNVQVWSKGQIKWLSFANCQFSYMESIFKHQNIYYLHGSFC